MHKKAEEALRILTAVGMPRAQQNERSALCLLAICDLKPNQKWVHARNPLIGITPIMEFAAQHYMKEPYAPNTRETIRRQSMHQFCDAGIAAYNPDKPDRPVNSPAAVYQITAEMLALVHTFGSNKWDEALKLFKRQRKSLADKYAAERELSMVPLRISSAQTIKLSPGEHSLLIQQIVEVFGPHYAPNGTLIYAGDTGDKWGFFDKEALEKLGVTPDSHGKFPDVIIYMADKNWLLLCESVTSHGPVDGKRHEELKRLFKNCKAGLVYVTAFPTRAMMARYLPVIAWETEVWCAESPTHLIHFNGTRFLGPY
ncbi:MAG: BsuBI/PstI family type II restriction endonuclease [Steroidobacteraceae bacterium]